MNTPNHIIIDGDAISIRPSEGHEYLVTTKEVARGYGVSEALIRKHKERHTDELIQGKHWVVTNSHTLGGEQATTFWTKRGVIRLGFFIRSERAKRFRDAAEDLILRISTGQTVEVKTSSLAALEQGFAALTKTVQQISELQGRFMLGQQRLQEDSERHRFGIELLHQRVASLELRTLGLVSTRPGARLHGDRLHISLDEVDAALFPRADSPVRWCGTSRALRLALAAAGRPYDGQIGLATLARRHPERIVDLRSLSRGAKRAFIIHHPLHVPDAIERQLLRADLIAAIEREDEA